MTSGAGRLQFRVMAAFQIKYVSLILLLCAMAFLSDVPAVEAEPQDVYRQAMQLAAQGHLDKAAARLEGAAVNLENGQNIWQERMQVAVALLAMQQYAADVPVLDAPLAASWPETGLIHRYLREHPAPRAGSTLISGLLAVILPGAGHAWQRRWRDAGMAALMVFPMLILTVWAAKRRMGPVTVFFALITIWLWSGTVFSSISLAERGNAEMYMAWWQGIWQASGLPGRPW